MTKPLPTGGSAAEVLPQALLSHWYNAHDYTPADIWRGLDPSRTALLLVDLINWQAHPDGGNLRGLRGVDAQGAEHLARRCADVLVPRLAALLPRLRAAGVQVVHAKLASRRPDFSDIVPAFRPYLAASKAIEGTWPAAPLAELGPDPRDLTVVKSGTGAFTSDLDVMLTDRGITTLLVAGVVTNACVLATVAAGFDLGYRQYMITDCTATLNDVDQLAAERFIGTYLAELVTAAEVRVAMDQMGSPA